MRIAIIANGEINDYVPTKQKLQNADHIIACDGGLRHAEAMEIWPDVIIGDLDSAPSTYLEACKRRSIPIHAYAVEKDDTDLALAMSYAMERSASSVIIFGALGGRVDHLIANYHVLVMSKGISAEIWDVNTSIHLVHDTLYLPKEDYKTLSLIPLSTEVTGIITQGLVYPLNGESLCMGTTRGVSNCFNKNVATIVVESGTLLAIRCK